MVTRQTRAIIIFSMMQDIFSKSIILSKDIDTSYYASERIPVAELDYNGLLSGHYWI